MTDTKYGPGPGSTPLVRLGTTTPVAWVCDQCGIGYSDPTIAENCCRPRLCMCGAETGERYLIKCPQCSNQADQVRLWNKFKRAEKIPISEYVGGALAIPDRGDESRFAYREQGFDVGDDVNEDIGWMWACTERGAPRIDAYDLLTGVFDEWYDDVLSSVDVAGLQILLDTWAAEQTVKGYWEDETRAVIFPPEEEVTPPL